MPKISVLMPSYNHEKYVYKAVVSVLEQSFTDFEFIIIDDASSDSSPKFLQRIEDPRVKVLFHEENKGVCQTINEAYELSTGEYIALIASDDMWHPKKLETQLEYLDENPDILAVFSTVNMIDEKDRPMKATASFAAGIDRLTVIREALKGCNYLNAPSEMLRRSAIDGEEFFYDLRFIQNQDLDQHLRVCLKGDIHVLPKPLVYYRWHGKNFSQPSNLSLYRTGLELGVILDPLLKLEDLDFIRELFPELAEELIHKDMIPFILGLEALKSDSFTVRYWGYSCIGKYFTSREKTALLKERAFFDLKDFYNLTEVIMRDK